MRLSELVEVSESVAGTRFRSAKTALLAGILKRVIPEEAAVAVSYLTGKPLQDRLGVGYATVSSVSAPPAGEAALEILEMRRWVGSPGPTVPARRAARRNCSRGCWPGPQSRSKNSSAALSCATCARAPWKA